MIARSIRITATFISLAFAAPAIAAEIYVHPVSGEIVQVK